MLHLTLEAIKKLLKEIAMSTNILYTNYHPIEMNEHIRMVKTITTIIIIMHSMLDILYVAFECLFMQITAKLKLFEVMNQRRNVLLKTQRAKTREKIAKNS